MKGPRKRPDYKWVIVSVSFIMVFFTLGFCSSNKSLYLSAITEALGIKRSLFSLNDSCRYISTATVNVFFGAAVAKYGQKRLIGAGFLALVISMMIYSFAEHITVFCLGGVFLGIGLAFTTTTMVGSVINRWWKEQRGKIMGFILAANGLGGAVAAQILSPIIYTEGTAFGYRKAYRIVALILAITGSVILLVFRDKRDASQTEEKPAVTKHGRSGGAWSAAMKKPHFIAAVICILLTGLVLQGINGVAAAHMKDVGLSPSYVALVLSVHSLALAGFKFLTGLIYDRRGLRVTMTICDVTAVAVIIMLASVNATTSGKVLAMVYGILSALALPLETIMLPLFAGDLFAESDYDRLLGVFVCVNTVGFAIGNPLTNWCFDRFGTYVPILYVFCGIMAAVTVSFQFILSAAGRERRRSAEAEAP